MNWAWLALQQTVAPSTVAAASPAPTAAVAWTEALVGCTSRLRLMLFCDLHRDYIHKIQLNFDLPAVIHETLRCSPRCCPTRCSVDAGQRGSFVCSLGSLRFFGSLPRRESFAFFMAQRVWIKKKLIPFIT